MPEHQQTHQSKESKSTAQKQATPRIQAPSSHPMAIIQRARMNPKSLTHADVMQLQSTIGNRAVVRLLSEIGAIPSKAKQSPPVQRQEIIQRQEVPEEEEPLQGKFESGPEKETCLSCMQRQEIPEEEEPLQRKMADTVQRQGIPEEEPLQGKLIEPIQRQEIPEEEEPLQGKMIGTIQRQEIPEEEEPLQGKFENKHEIACPSCSAAPIVQRQEIPEEEEPLQGKMIGTVQRQEIPEEEEPLQTKRENNTGMPDNLKAGVENLSGIDMSDVRVHYNSSKPAGVGALAYTQGKDIHVAQGQERHLPHEAWHVVQQKQGRVRSTMQMKEGMLLNDDVALEKEASLMGSKAVQMKEGRQYLIPETLASYESTARGRSVQVVNIYGTQLADSNIAANKIKPITGKNLFITKNVPSTSQGEVIQCMEDPEGRIAKLYKEATLPLMTKKEWNYYKLEENLIEIIKKAVDEQNAWNSWKDFIKSHLTNTNVDKASGVDEKMDSHKKRILTEIKDREELTEKLSKTPSPSSIPMEISDDSGDVSSEDEFLGESHETIEEKLRTPQVMRRFEEASKAGFIGAKRKRMLTMGEQEQVPALAPEEGKIVERLIEEGRASGRIVGSDLLVTLAAVGGFKPKKSGGRLVIGTTTNPEAASMPMGKGRQRGAKINEVGTYLDECARVRERRKVLSDADQVVIGRIQRPKYQEMMIRKRALKRHQTLSKSSVSMIAKQLTGLIYLIHLEAERGPQVADATITGLGMVEEGLLPMDKYFTDYAPMAPSGATTAMEKDKIGETDKTQAEVRKRAIATRLLMVTRWNKFKNPKLRRIGRAMKRLALSDTQETDQLVDRLSQYLISLVIRSAQRPTIRRPKLKFQERPL